MNKHQKQKLTSALLYGEKGWRVFPCGINKKPKITQWQLRATTDLDIITGFWKENPGALIGIATGEESGFWVLDIDMKEGKDGFKSIQEYFNVKEIELPKKGIVAQTWSGGFHFYYKWCEGDTIANKQPIIKDVDVRGEGGYIIAPPSAILDKNGEWKSYEWGDGLDWTNEVQPPPEWVKSLPKLQEKAKKVDVNKALIGLNKGERDIELFRLAALLRQKNIHYQIAESVILYAAERCGFPEDEAKIKVDQAYGYENEEEEDIITKRLEQMYRKKMGG
jgi:hypothetical protein